MLIDKRSILYFNESKYSQRDNKQQLMAKGNWESYFDAVKKQDWKTAKNLLMQISQAERNNPQTFLKIGDICQRTGEKSEAISAYLHAAQVLRIQGFAQKALATYKIALRLDPDNQDIIKRAEILIEEFEAVKASPHIPISQPEEKPEKAWTAPEPVSEPKIEVPSPEWLEPTSAEAPEVSPEEIKPSEWLEITSLNAPASEAAAEQSIFEPAEQPRITEDDRNGEAAEAEAGSENTDWLESAYEALDTKMFKTGEQQPAPDIQPEPDIDSLIEHTRLVPENLTEDIETFNTPLSERREISVPEIFEELPEDMVRNFMAELKLLAFSDGQKVIEEGDSGDSMYIIKSGQANVIAHLLGKRVDLAQLRDGDIFGEVGFLTGRPRTASVIASGKLQLYEISRLDIEKLIETQPDILAKIEDFYEMRVRDTIKKIKG